MDRTCIFSSHKRLSFVVRILPVSKFSLKPLSQIFGELLLCDPSFQFNMIHLFLPMRVGIWAIVVKWAICSCNWHEVIHECRCAALLYSLFKYRLVGLWFDLLSLKHWISLTKVHYRNFSAECGQQLLWFRMVSHLVEGAHYCLDFWTRRALDCRQREVGSISRNLDVNHCFKWVI